MKAADDYLQSVLDAAIPDHEVRFGVAPERFRHNIVVLYSLLPGSRDYYTFGARRQDRTQYPDLRYEIRVWGTSIPEPDATQADPARLPMLDQVAHMIEIALNPGPDGSPADHDPTKPYRLWGNRNPNWSMLSCVREGALAYQTHDVGPDLVRYTRGGIYRLLMQYDAVAGG